MKKILWQFSGLLCLGVCLAGCIETKQHFTLNPDGSGKVVYEMTMVPSQVGLSTPEDTQPRMKGVVKDVLNKSNGVDAWQDIEYKILDDERVYFKGTAYFPDINELEVYQGGFTTTMMKIKYTRVDNGDYLLTIENEQSEDAAGTPSESTPPEELTEEELTKKIAQEKQGYQQIKPMLMGMLGNMKMDMTFTLPDPIKGQTNFDYLANGDLQVVFDGQIFLSAIEQVVEDDAYWRKAVLAGRNFAQEGPVMDYEMNEMLYGEKGPIQVSIGTDATPLFNYSEEVEQAEAQYEAHLKEIDLGAAIPLPQAEGGAFKDLKVGGVRLVRYSNSNENIRPFNYDMGFALSLIGELPGAVLSVEKGKVTKAQADTGQNLLPKSDFSRSINFPHLSEDKGTVIFDIDLELPADEVQRIAVIEGELEYLTANKTKQVDLGISTFQAGVRGDVHGAYIGSIEANQWQDGEEVLSIVTDLSSSAIKEAFFFDAQGKSLEVEKNMTSTMNDITTIGYSIKGQFPEKGRIELLIYDDLKRYRIPFRLENIDLLGRPVQ